MQTESHPTPESVCEKPDQVWIIYPIPKQKAKLATMYQYDEFDQNLVTQRSAEFRTQVQRRLDGLISEAEFKPLRLMNGLYLQLHAYMLRVAIPYGVLSASQMNKLAHIADRYDRGYGHFTTRQNIQFNWPQLVETPDILDELASVQMHAIQTSGNCIRNITTDPFAGVAADEDVDPRPLAELLRQWSTLHPEFRYLPRKFKFAITGSANDRAAIKVHDIGLRLKKDRSGATMVDVWLGGGQGRTPKIAQLFRENVPINELLPYLEAAMRVYNLYGRRDNKYKARIKILLAEIGLQKLQHEIEQEFQNIDLARFIPASTELERITHRFHVPDYVTHDTASQKEKEFEVEANNPDYVQWLQQNVKEHRVDGHAIVVVSLKRIGDIPGDASADEMRAIAAIAEQYSHSEIRVTHRQNLVLPHVHKQHLFKLWRALHAVSLASSNIDMPSDIIACPGLDYCALATARSIPVAQKIATHLKHQEASKSPNGVSINISGCINACAHHHVANIGILGLDRGGVENYQITLGGRNDENARIGDRMGPGLSANEIPTVVERVIDLYLDKRQLSETFSDTYERVGKKVFKEVIYGDESVQQTA